MSRGRILLVDDDRDLLKAAADWLEISGFSVSAFDRAEEAYRQLMREESDVVMTDIRMPGIDGMTLLSSIVRTNGEVPVILMTGHGDVAVAVRAMKQGAEDFIEKPYDAEHLLSVLDKAVEKRRMKQEIARLQGLVRESGGVEIVGDSPAIRNLRGRIAMLADVDIDVL
ncbi:response regulator, partial [Sinorhizobium medicae]